MTSCDRFPTTATCTPVLFGAGNISCSTAAFSIVKHITAFFLAFYPFGKRLILCYMPAVTRAAVGSSVAGRGKGLWGAPAVLLPGRYGGMANGTVKWFSPKKGYGFITMEDGQEVFVHYSAIDGAGFRSLEQGERVEFEVAQGPKGLQASNVNKG